MALKDVRAISGKLQAKGHAFAGGRSLQGHTRSYELAALRVRLFAGLLNERVASCGLCHHR